ncbi:MAG TPA: DNA polymerase III subunit epsilon [Candidatus Stackebrandtia excrementipullorum]|nr:DNA polymerase III subunit epsilon [Candidatus Stackebrandtia excrementipullorum]
MTWHTDPLIGFDTETTGVDNGTDRIVTAAVVDGADVSTWFIDPGVEIPAAASAVHGITTERAQAEGVSPAEALPEIVRALTKAAEENVPVVAYRAGFDLTLLANELVRHGIPPVPWNDLRVIDPFILDKRCDKWRKGKRTLSAVCEHYDVLLTQAHSAAADATAAVSLARAIGHRYGQVARMNTAELHTAQIGWHADDAASLEAYLRRQGRDETVDRRWPLQL